MSYDMEQVWVCKDGICGMSSCLRCTTSERGAAREAKLRAALAEAERDRDEARGDANDYKAWWLNNQAARVAAEASLAQARAECDRLNAAVLALQEGRAGAERALAQAQEAIIREATIIAPLGQASGEVRWTVAERLRALASALGRGEGGGTT